MLSLKDIYKMIREKKYIEKTINVNKLFISINC